MLNPSTKSRRLLLCAPSYFSRATSTIPAITQPRRLEVERKFPINKKNVVYIASNNWETRLKGHEYLGKQTTHDIYYDKEGMLFSKGVYVRQRNNKWEAKVRTGGDFTNSAFREVDGIDAVKEVIERSLGLNGGNDYRHDIEDMLTPCADFVTERDSWMLDGKFKVDVDMTDFGHSVGEVELTSILPSNVCGSIERGKASESKMKEKMDQEIEGFMKRYPDAFPAGRAVGKLTAYFEKFGWNVARVLQQEHL
ncbi:hypothetical protein AJ79_08469 [Helicocarpus griseus UAMH5409]|uniref:CYTH domain-containing protein n=1 Tax=Helicocarpus griseus UAMH5409 TaxID=1447875 RepID=A0A2B7WSN9_9EURO|nr:hypothetical protein AJ79_08469 [Helicocarpus griseus UAMH5409]